MGHSSGMPATIPINKQNQTRKRPTEQAHSTSGITKRAYTNSTRKDNFPETSQPQSKNQRKLYSTKSANQTRINASKLLLLNHINTTLKLNLSLHHVHITPAIHDVPYDWNCSPPYDMPTRGSGPYPDGRKNLQLYSITDHRALRLAVGQGWLKAVWKDGVDAAVLQVQNSEEGDGQDKAGSCASRQELVNEWDKKEVEEARWMQETKKDSCGAKEPCPHAEASQLQMHLIGELRSRLETAQQQIASLKAESEELKAREALFRSMLK
ncbi:hypothetical protein BJ508DRAFT_312104 [Ascobolus immersus RN42]|uniref:Uncharacterized protein n=1 Tax=Ascobolus immersus RN42 TaxID=1160509 RepID=A0A3N4HN70_ASCIM|nr:hypothetical protein BJ508DRAFT_312104 [Ascobolus immersus RN42]